jgi:hypothetical protein
VSDVIATQHPRSRFERRMHRRRAQRARRAWDRQAPFPALRPPPGHRSARRRMRQRWSYDVVHGLAGGSALMD